MLAFALELYWADVTHTVLRYCHNNDNLEWLNLNSTRKWDGDGSYNLLQLAPTPFNTPLVCSQEFQVRRGVYVPVSARISERL